MEKDIEFYGERIAGMKRQIDSVSKQIREYEQIIERLKRCRFYGKCSPRVIVCFLDSEFETCKIYQQKMAELKEKEKEELTFESMIQNQFDKWKREEIDILKNLFSSACERMVEVRDKHIIEKVDIKQIQKAIEKLEILKAKLDKHKHEDLDNGYSWHLVIEVIKILRGGE